MHVRVEGGGEEGRVCACEGGGGGWEECVHVRVEGGWGGKSVCM